MLSIVQEPTQASSQQHALPLASLSLGLLHAGLLKNAQNLLKITHDLKLLHLLSPSSAAPASAPPSDDKAAATANTDDKPMAVDEVEHKVDTQTQAASSPSLDALRAEVATLEKEWQRSTA